MKLGLGLYRHMLNQEHYAFAVQAGCTHIIAHLVDYFKGQVARSTTVKGIGERLCPVYDSLHPCQLKSAHSFPRWSGRCQGRRTLAFILTLDSDPATVIIEPGSNLERSFRDSNHSWKPFFHC